MLSTNDYIRSDLKYTDRWHQHVKKLLSKISFRYKLVILNCSFRKISFATWRYASKVYLLWMSVRELPSRSRELLLRIGPTDEVVFLHSNLMFHLIVHLIAIFQSHIEVIVEVWAKQMKEDGISLSPQRATRYTSRRREAEAIGFIWFMTDKKGGMTDGEREEWLTSNFRNHHSLDCRRYKK